MVRLKGSVENFDIQCSLEIDFIDERINNDVIFDNNNIYTNIKDYFYTNLHRQKIDNGSLNGGFMKNNSIDENRLFDVKFKFNDVAKLGDNKCILDATLNLGKTSYNKTISPLDKLLTIVNH
jgi:hypothetical protein